MDKAGNHASNEVGPTAPAASASVSQLPATTTTSATVVHVERPKASAGDGSGLLPAWLALVGVIVTLIGKGISDRIQRSYELRRQLYLDLVDATITANACIGKICDASIPLSTTAERFQEAAPALAKAEVTAPKMLSQALTRHRDASGKSFMKLMAMRVEVERLRADSADADIGITQFEAERRVFLEERRRMTIEGIVDPGREDRVQRHYEIFSKELNALYERKKANAASMQQRVAAMGAVAMEDLKVLTGLTPPILKHVRRGLGYWRFDIRDFAKRTDATAGMAGNALKDLRDSVESPKDGDKKGG